MTDILKDIKKGYEKVRDHINSAIRDADESAVRSVYKADRAVIRAIYGDSYQESDFLDDMRQDRLRSSRQDEEWMVKSHTDQSLDRERGAQKADERGFNEIAKYLRLILKELQSTGGPAMDATPEGDGEGKPWNIRNEFNDGG